MKRFSTAFILALNTALTSLVLAPGCSSEPASADAVESDVTLRTNYEISFPEYNAIYDTNFSNADDAYSVVVKLGDRAVKAPTHLFGERVNVIPYSNTDNVKTADGQVLEYGDSIIGKVFKPGEVGIAVKHHRSNFPTLNLNRIGDPDEMKEHFKLQDTHIEVVVGVRRSSVDRAVTLNNPQDYSGSNAADGEAEAGFFGDEEYAMIFLKPVYPDYLTAEQKKAFEDNVRTMLVGFNAVTHFPDDYNGGDPLAARDPEKVREYVKHMVLAINGHRESREWFERKENLVYCAELAFLSFSAGLIVPLNDETMIPLVGRKDWHLFKDAISIHNGGLRTEFRTLNRNPRVEYIRDLTTAPAGLRPAAAYGPPGEEKKLALQPMTQADMLDEFMRTHLPRELFGEGLASAQAAVLEAMKPALLEQTRLNELPETDPRRQELDAFFAKLVEAVGQSYGSYAEFRTAVEPYLAQGRAITGPRGDSGEGLFVPPSLFHVAAQGRHAGLLRFQYEGHGVHASAVKAHAGETRPPTPVGEIAARVSCENQCGGQAAGGCFCDPQCAESGDCCSDYAAVCGGARNTQEN